MRFGHILILYQKKNSFYSFIFLLPPINSLERLHGSFPQCHFALSTRVAKKQRVSGLEAKVS